MRRDISHVVSRLTTLEETQPLGRNIRLEVAARIDYAPVRRIITAMSALCNFPIMASNFPASGDAIAFMSSILEEERRAQSLLLPSPLSSPVGRR